jgi:hypothetical protein
LTGIEPFQPEGYVGQMDHFFNVALALFDIETAMRALVGLVPAPVWLVCGAAGIVVIAAAICRLNSFRDHPHA